MKKFVVGLLLAGLVQLGHAAEPDELLSETIGGHSDLVGIWDLERTRETDSTPVTTTSTLTVTDQIDGKRYRIATESKSVQYMAEGQRIWKKRVCRKKKKANPCTWESKSKGVLTLNGRNAYIEYDSPRYLPDTLVLKGDVMEGRDPNGPLRYVKRR
jgi:hypothetical protein